MVESQATQSTPSLEIDGWVTGKVAHIQAILALSREVNGVSLGMVFLLKATCSVTARLDTLKLSKLLDAVHEQASDQWTNVTDFLRNRRVDR